MVRPGLLGSPGRPTPVEDEILRQMMQAVYVNREYRSKFKVSRVSVGFNPVVVAPS